VKCKEKQTLSHLRVISVSINFVSSINKLRKTAAFNLHATSRNTAMRRGGGHKPYYKQQPQKTDVWPLMVMCN